jgi:hypothetical protein
MRKIGIVLTAVGAGALACVIWLLPLGYAFQVVLLGLVAAVLSYAGAVSWKIWSPALTIPVIAFQAILMTKTQALSSVLAMQGFHWTLIVLAVALGGLAGGFARRHGSTPVPESVSGRAPGSRRWLFYLGVPLAAVAFAVAFTMTAFAMLIVVEIGILVIGVPAAAVGIGFLRRKRPKPATVALSIALFFVALLPLQPLAARAEEARILRVLRSYCESLVPMLNQVKASTGSYPRSVNESPFSDVETPQAFGERAGRVLYTTDGKQFDFVVYRREPVDRSQTYNGETGRWVEGTHYPSTHGVHILPTRTRYLLIDGSGKQTTEWRTTWH